MIGLFFGSFNPIHKGHTALAKFLLNSENLNEIWFIVSPLNPLKKQEGLLADQLRFNMVLLAIKEEAHFKACNIEFSLPKPNYTYITLRELHKRYPEQQFSLIIGADNLAIFNKWRNFQEILETCQLLVYPRPDTDLKPLKKQYPQMKISDAPLYPISATIIRQNIKQGLSNKSYLNPEVETFIRVNKLYKD